jgi:hypothetical protein
VHGRSWTDKVRLSAGGHRLRSGKGSEHSRGWFGALCLVARDAIPFRPDRCGQVAEACAVLLVEALVSPLGCFDCRHRELSPSKPSAVAAPKSHPEVRQRRIRIADN